MLSEMVQEHDEPILKHLFDIKVIFLESNPMVSFGHIVHRYTFYTYLCLHDTITQQWSGKSSVTSGFEIKSSGM